MRTRDAKKPPTKDKQSPWGDDVEDQVEVDLNSDINSNPDLDQSQGPRDKQSPWGDPETETEEDKKTEEDPEIDDPNDTDEWDAEKKDKDKKDDGRGEWDPTKDTTWDANLIQTVEQDDRIIRIENLICAVKDTQMIQALQLPCYVEECKMKLKKIEEFVCKSNNQSLIASLQINCATVIQDTLTRVEIRCIMNRFIALLYDVTGKIVKTYTQLSDTLLDCAAACLGGRRMDPLPIIDPSDPTKPNITADLIPYLTQCAIFVSNAESVTTWKEVITIISNCVLNSSNPHPTNPKVSPAQLICIVTCFSESLFDPKDPIINYKKASEVLSRCGSECLQLPVEPPAPYDPSDPTKPLLTPEQVKCLASCAKNKYMSDSTTIHDWSGVLAAYTKCITDCITGGGGTVTVTQAQLVCIMDTFAGYLAAGTVTNYTALSTTLVAAGDHCLNMKLPPLQPIDPLNPSKPDINETIITCLEECSLTVKRSTSITTWDGILAAVKACVTSCVGTTPTPPSPKVTTIQIQQIIDLFMVLIADKTEYTVNNFKDVSELLVKAGENVLKEKLSGMQPINPADPTYPLVTLDMRDCITKNVFQIRGSTTIDTWDGILSAVSKIVTSCVGAAPSGDYPNMTAVQLTCVVDSIMNGIQQWIPKNVPVPMKTMAWRPGSTMADPTELDQNDGPPGPHTVDDALATTTTNKNYKDLSDLLVRSGTQCLNVTVAAPQDIVQGDPTQPALTTLILQSLLYYKTTLSDSTTIKDWATFLNIFKQCFIKCTEVVQPQPESPKVGADMWRNIITQFMANSSDPSTPVTNFKTASAAIVTSGEFYLKVVVPPPQPINPSDPTYPPIDTNQFGCLTNALVTEMNNCSSPPAGWSAPADWNAVLERFTKFIKTCCNIAETLLESTPPDFNVHARIPGHTKAHILQKEHTPLDAVGVDCFTACLTQRIKDPSKPSMTHYELCDIYEDCSNKCAKDGSGMTPTFPCMAEFVKECAPHSNVPRGPSVHIPGKTQALVNRYNDMEGDAHTEYTSGYAQIDHLRRTKDALAKGR